MRESQRAEVQQISVAVTRDMLVRSNAMAEVTNDLHQRLPEMIRGHAQYLLPQLAMAAVEAATPDRAETQAAVVNAAHRRLDVELPKLVAAVANALLPDLARHAIRTAAPDPAVLRSELAASASAEASVVINREAVAAIAGLIGDATDRVTAEVGESLRTECGRLAEKVAAEATTVATQRADDVRNELVRQAEATLGERVRSATESAAVDAVATATDAVRDSLAETAGKIVGEAESAASEAMDKVRQTAKAEQRKVAKEIGASVETAVDRKLAEFTPNVVEVVLPNKQRVRLDVDTHKVLPDILVALHARCHVLLVGPAGTGKSMLAMHAAKALKVPFQALSLGPTTPMSKVFGYYDANGNYHGTPFRRAFEHGGVMLLDELDNGHPGLLAELNQALALGTCAFADTMVEAHQDFRLVATGNTYGTGANRQYVGRQALDAATLDRFVMIDIPIDEKLEERLAIRHAPSHKDAARKLVKRIRDLRRLAETKNLPVILSPRACIDGAKLLEAGATIEQVLAWRITRGLSATQRTALGID